MLDTSVNVKSDSASTHTATHIEGGFRLVAQYPMLAMLRVIARMQAKGQLRFGRSRLSMYAKGENFVATSAGHRIPATAYLDWQQGIPLDPVA